MQRCIIRCVVFEYMQERSGFHEKGTSRENFSMIIIIVIIIIVIVSTQARSS